MLMRLAPPGRLLVERLRGCTCGVAAIEFALIGPIILTIGLFGIETAYLNTVDLKLSQMAMTVADNASRLGQTDNSSVTPTVTETDIAEIMRGVEEEGASIDFETRGRVILSSLEKDSATGKQYIHWQRCYGNLERNSAYGDDGANNGLNGDPLEGMGSGTAQITATSSSTAVMFVEVYYSYEGLFGDMFLDDRVLRKEGAFLIRDDRNLTPGVTGTGGQHDCT